MELVLAARSILPTNVRAHGTSNRGGEVESAARSVSTKDLRCLRRRHVLSILGRRRRTNHTSGTAAACIRLLVPRRMTRAARRPGVPAASASSALTQSFTCPSASDHNQSIRIVCSSATKHSISAEARIVRASDRNRKRRRIIGNGAPDRPIGASKTATSNPRRAISARSDSRAASESDPPSVASFRGSPSFMLAYNFANRFRSFSGSGIVTVCAINALDYSNPSEALLRP